MVQASIFDKVQSTNQKPSQAKRMLQKLIERGKIGVRNYEFSNDMHILNYKARKHELVKDGYVIDVKYTPQYGEGVYTYYLVPQMEFGDV